jgi:hypothetical protein
VLGLSSIAFSCAGEHKTSPTNSKLGEVHEYVSHVCLGRGLMLYSEQIGTQIMSSIKGLIQPQWVLYRLRFFTIFS